MKTIQPLSDELWQELEKITGVSLTENSRKRIDGTNIAFSLVGSIHDTKNTVLASEILPELRSWITATERLRRALNLKPPPENHQYTLEEVILPFSGKESVRNIGKMLPLEFLSVVVQSANATGKIVERQLAEDIGGKITGDLWSAWVCLLAIYLGQADARISASSSDKVANDSPFVLAVELLQSSLPPSCHRLKGYESLAKGIQRARRALGGLSERDLLLILVGWGSETLKHYPGALEKKTPSEISEFVDIAQKVLHEIGRRTERNDAHDENRS